jgi:rod shape-determining protein MreD
MTNVSYTSREQIEVYQFRWPISIGVPLLALFLQAFVPVHWFFFRTFDLPLLVTIFFAVSRRNPVSGLVLGAAVGLAQDTLTGQPIGMYGIAKTFVGYGASSLGVKIDVENPGTRFLMTYAFYVVHQFIYFTISKGLVGEARAWHWGHEVIAALANSLLALVLFAFLDRFKERT